METHSENANGDKKVQIESAKESSAPKAASPQSPSKDVPAPSLPIEHAKSEAEVEDNDTSNVDLKNEATESPTCADDDDDDNENYDDALATGTSSSSLTPAPPLNASIVSSTDPENRPPRSRLFIRVRGHSGNTPEDPTEKLPTEDFLRHIFNKFGMIDNIHVLYEKSSPDDLELKKPKGTAFVKFATAAAAECARKEIANNLETGIGIVQTGLDRWGTVELEVSVAQPKGTPREKTQRKKKDRAPIRANQDDAKRRRQKGHDTEESDDVCRNSSELKDDAQSNSDSSEITSLRSSLSVGGSSRGRKRRRKRTRRNAAEQGRPGDVKESVGGDGNSFGRNGLTVEGAMLSNAQMDQRLSHAYSEHHEYRDANGGKISRRRKRRGTPSPAHLSPHGAQPKQNYPVMNRRKRPATYHDNRNFENFYPVGYHGQHRHQLRRFHHYPNEQQQHEISLQRRQHLHAMQHYKVLPNMQQNAQSIYFVPQEPRDGDGRTPVFANGGLYFNASKGEMVEVTGSTATLSTQSSSAKIEPQQLSILVTCAAPAPVKVIRELFEVYPGLVQFSPVDVTLKDQNVELNCVNLEGADNRQERSPSKMSSENIASTDACQEEGRSTEQYASRIVVRYSTKTATRQVHTDLHRTYVNQQSKDILMTVLLFEKEADLQASLKPCKLEMKAVSYLAHRETSDADQNDKVQISDAVDNLSALTVSGKSLKDSKRKDITTPIDKTDLSRIQFAKSGEQDKSLHPSPSLSVQSNSHSHCSEEEDQAEDEEENEENESCDKVKTSNFKDSPNQYSSLEVNPSEENSPGHLPSEQYSANDYASGNEDINHPLLPSQTSSSSSEQQLSEHKNQHGQYTFHPYPLQNNHEPYVMALPGVVPNGPNFGGAMHAQQVPHQIHSQNQFLNPQMYLYGQPHHIGAFHSFPLQQQQITQPQNHLLQQQHQQQLSHRQGVYAYGWENSHAAYSSMQHNQYPHHFNLYQQNSSPQHYQHQARMQVSQPQISQQQFMHQQQILSEKKITSQLRRRTKTVSQRRRRKSSQTVRNEPAETTSLSKD